MALSGNYIHITYTENETDLVPTSVTYPTNLLEDDEDYNKRGTTEEILLPALIEVPITYNNCYIIVKAASVHIVNQFVDNKSYSINAIYRVYNNKEEKAQDYEEGYLKEITESFNWDWDINSNPFEAAYSYFKTLKGAENLIND
jgi:hypothetical protein